MGNSEPRGRYAASVKPFSLAEYNAIPRVGSMVLSPDGARLVLTVQALERARNVSLVQSRQNNKVLERRDQRGFPASLERKIDDHVGDALFAEC